MPDIALVTGTSRGLGTAIAHALLSEGWRVHGVSRSQAPTALGSSERYVHHVQDLSEARGAEEWFEGSFVRAAGAPRRVALINNAGRLAPLRGIHATHAREWVQNLTLNVAVPAWLMGACATQFPDAALRIVNLSSGAATSAYPGWGAYCASKAALRMAGQVFAAEAEELPAHAGRDVRVVDYAPGVLATAMQAEIRAADPAHFPRRARFEALLEDGALADPSGPAREIVRLVEDGLRPRYEELRYPAFP
ncbi:MAG: SDR family NAD(P)-dependent oxidoreductase [Planctomycetota bacterium]